MASGCHCSRACSSLDVGRGSALACLRKPLRRCVPLFPLLCVPSPLLLALRPELTPLVGAPHGPVFHRRCLTRERAHATETCSLAPAIHDPRDGGVRCRPLSPDYCPTSMTTSVETNSHYQHAFHRRTMAPTSHQGSENLRSATQTTVPGQRSCSVSLVITVLELHAQNRSP